MKEIDQHARIARIDWEIDAYMHLTKFVRLAKRKRHSFLAEEVRQYAMEKGLDDSQDARAWGGVIRLANKNGLIEKIGAMPARTSNHSLKTLWIAL